MTSTALATIDIASARAAAFIRKGQRAWTEIKKTAEEQRTLWLEVGVALMYGKVKENRPVTGKDSRGRTKYQKFSLWVAEMFPGLHANEARCATVAALSANCAGTKRPTLPLGVPLTLPAPR